MIEYVDRTLAMHRGGKIEQHNKYPLKTRDDLSMAYTPGVARVCMEIASDRSKAFDYTIKRNTVAVVSDGSAVLGLGDIGPEAAMPVMEGKAMLFKEFAGIDAFPICLDTNDPDRIIDAVKLLAPTFGGSTSRTSLRPLLRDRGRAEGGGRHPGLPRRSARHRGGHDGGAVQRAEDRRQADLRHQGVMLGLGAAGVAVTKMMLASGVTKIIGCDRRGALSTQREDYVDGRMTEIKRWYSENSNPEGRLGPPAEVIEDADLFVGLSGPGLIEASALDRMADDAIVFAMANPTPEVMPEEAEPYVRIMATGRSDYPNQINNVLCFPGSSAAPSTPGPRGSPRR